MWTVMAYDLIVFDWDGTLMDSIGTIVACAQRTLADQGLPAVLDHQIRDLVGLRLLTIAERLIGGHDPSLHARFVEIYSQHWRTTFRGQLFPLSCSGAVLQALADRYQMMAVATGKSRRGLETDLDSTGFRRYFAATRTVDESPSKPSPGMVLELMDELGVRPDKTLVVGDTTHDVLMARNAEVDVVGVLSGSHGESVLREAGALECLRDVGKLLAWLDRPVSSTGTSSGPQTAS
ncbi:MAG: HAD-IA family hydrolase [Acidobacteriota bacterium]